MTPSESIEQMKAKLPELYTIDCGYALGKNAVKDADHPNGLPQAFAAQSGSKWLNDLYLACDGLSFPDVHVGYFLKPLDQVVAFDHSSKPVTVVLEREVDVLPIGSTGGGSLFVIGCELGNVLLLPPGPLRDGRYYGTRGSVREVAATVPLFLERLLSDLVAFIDDDRQHNYLA